MTTARFGQPSEVWMYRQARGMNRLALKVLCHHHDHPEQSPPDGFEIEVLTPPADRKLPAVLGQVRQQWWSWRNRHYGGFRRHPQLARLWDQHLKADRPQVVLCHYGSTAVQMAPLLLSRQVPLVAHFNGFDLSSALQRPVYRRQLANYAPRFAACVVVAEYMAEWLREHGVSQDRIHRIPYGVPIADLQVAGQVGQQPCRFLMVGRLTPKKRPDLSIRAFAQCGESAPDATLTIIGDGPLEDECRALAQQLGVFDKIAWLGSQPFDAVQKNLAAASAFVQHSVTADSGDKEGWPVAIAEAAGSGLPVIATRHASIPEQIEDGVTGLLCDEGDWRTMGQHMTHLATQPQERQAMGAAARQKLEAFDTPGQIRQLEDLLLSCAR